MDFRRLTRESARDSLSTMSGAAIKAEIAGLLSAAVAPFLLTCATAYFAYHALEGERGFGTHNRLTQDIEETRKILALVVSERERLDRQAALLRTGALDLDMLDERARAVLGLIHPGEVVIYTK